MVGFHTRRFCTLLVMLFFCLPMLFFDVESEGSTNEPPVAHIGSILPFPAQANTELTFKGTGQDEDGYIVWYEWDFDGNGIFEWNSSLTGTTEFQYDEAATYQPKFRVRDNNGTWSEENTVQLEVGPAPVIPEKDEGSGWGGQIIILGLLAITVLVATAATAALKYTTTGVKLKSKLYGKRTVKEGAVASRCPVCATLSQKGDEACKECGAELLIESRPKPIKTMPHPTRATLKNKVSALGVGKMLVRRKEKAKAAKAAKGGKKRAGGAPTYLVEWNLEAMIPALSPWMAKPPSATRVGNPQRVAIP